MKSIAALATTSLVVRRSERGPFGEVRRRTAQAEPTPMTVIPEGAAQTIVDVVSESTGSARPM